MVSFVALCSQQSSLYFLKFHIPTWIYPPTPNPTYKIVWQVICFQVNFQHQGATRSYLNWVTLLVWSHVRSLSETFPTKKKPFESFAVVLAMRKLYLHHGCKVSHFLESSFWNKFIWNEIAQKQLSIHCQVGLQGTWILRTQKHSRIFLRFSSREHSRRLRLTSGFGIVVSFGRSSLKNTDVRKHRHRENR